jgi:hypothetical protein
MVLPMSFIKVKFYSSSTIKSVKSSKNFGRCVDIILFGNRKDTAALSIPIPILTGISTTIANARQGISLLFKDNNGYP